MSQPAHIPAHVGIIMDGNRRWAQQHGQPAIEGHRAGFEALKRTAERALDQGVQELSVFAFSSENWRRSREEVEGLFDLCRWVLKNQIDELHRQNIRVRVLGSRVDVPEDLHEQFTAAESQTASNDRGVLNILFNYGGRQDLVEAIRDMLRRDDLAAEEVDENVVSQHLATSGMRDVDLLIRTTEYRLSGFLPWESVYAEVYFQPDVLWPDFDGDELDKALEFYGQRQRRFGT